MENEPTRYERGAQQDRTGPPDEPRRYGVGGEPGGQGRQPPETRWGGPRSGAGQPSAEQPRPPESGPPPQAGSPRTGGQPPQAGPPFQPEPPQTAPPSQAGPPPQAGPQGQQPQYGGSSPDYGGFDPGYGRSSREYGGATQQYGEPDRRYGGQEQVPRQPSAPQPGQRLLRPITADDLVQRDVVTAQRDMPVRTAVAAMVENDVGTVVVTDDQRAVGILTDRMVATALESDPDVPDREVGDLMTGDLVTVSIDSNVDDVLSVLVDAGIRRVPVVDDQQHLQGIVSLDDLIVLLASQLDRVGQVIEKQAPRF